MAGITSGLDGRMWIPPPPRSYPVTSAVLKDYRGAAALGERAMAGLDELRQGRGATLHRAVYFGRMWRDPR